MPAPFLPAGDPAGTEERAGRPARADERAGRRRASGFVDPLDLSAPDPVLSQVRKAALEQAPGGPRADAGEYASPVAVSSTVADHRYGKGRGDDASGSGQVSQRHHAALAWTLGVILAVALACLVIWTLFYSDAFKVRSSDVSVSGTGQWATSQEVASILAEQTGVMGTEGRQGSAGASGSTGKGRSLLLVSSSAIRTSLLRLPGVEGARVSKRYPHGLDVAIVQRTPRAQIADGKRFLVVDGTGIVMAVSPTQRDGLPVITASGNVDAGEGRRVSPPLREAVRVLSGIPSALRDSLSRITAPTEDSVTAVTNSGITIVWGNSERMSLKSAIAERLIVNDGLMNGHTAIDVSAPDRPIVR